MNVDIEVLALVTQDPLRLRSFYRVNGIFVGMERSVQEQIIRYIFSQQRLIRQRWTA